MEYHIYKRHSTDKQTAAQQSQTINRWLKKNNITPSSVITESEHGDKSYKDRELGRMIRTIKSGSTIVVSEFSRLNRGGEVESFKMYCDLVERGLKMYCIFEDLMLGDKEMTLIEYIQLGIHASKAKSELDSIRNRTKEGLSAKREALEKDGYFVSSRTGRKITGFGNPNIPKAQEKATEAAAKAKQERAAANIMFKQAWGMMVNLKKDGLTNKEVAKKLNDLGYRTSTGRLFLPQSIPQDIKRGNKYYLQ